MIPKFLDDPVDLIGLRLLDLHAALAFHVAAADGRVGDVEREAVRTHFVQDWGYASAYLDVALPLIERDVASDDASLADVVDRLRSLYRTSRDCAGGVMAGDLLAFLRELTEADGVVDPAERAALATIREHLAGPGWSLAAARADAAEWAHTLAKAAGSVGDEVVAAARAGHARTAAATRGAVAAIHGAAVAGSTSMARLAGAIRKRGTAEPIDPASSS